MEDEDDCDRGDGSRPGVLALEATAVAGSSECLRFLTLEEPEGKFGCKDISVAWA